MNYKTFLSITPPPQIAALERDKRGYPIPFVAVVSDNKKIVDFAAIDHTRWTTCVKYSVCAICGTPLSSGGRLMYFVGGPICEHNRLFFDPPMHKDCAEYALQVCPFLSMARSHYMKKHCKHKGVEIVTSKSTSDVKPERFMLGATDGYGLVRVNNERLMMAHVWESVVWYVNGVISCSAMAPTLLSQKAANLPASGTGESAAAEPVACPESNATP